MNNKSLNKMTLKDFKELEYFEPKEYFNDIIIVPTDNVHDSGYRCMKFVLWNSQKLNIFFGVFHHEMAFLSGRYTGKTSNEEEFGVIPMTQRRWQM